MVIIGDGYDIVLVLDVDNFMECSFLIKVNDVFDWGYWIVQGYWVVKNFNMLFVILDVVSEEVNNQIFCKGYWVLGLFLVFIGFGMAFDYVFFKEMMVNVKVVGGFDKEFEFKLLCDW